MVGGEKQAETAAQDRGSYRTVIGERLGREIILSPR